MVKSRGTTESKSRFFGVKHAQLREWSWACLLIGGAVVSHLWRNQAWERRLRELPRATVPQLLCWLEEKEDLTKADFRKFRGSRGASERRLPASPKRASVFSKPRPILNINEANAAEWATLPGIGTVLSQRIVKFREAMGGFVEIEQLLRVYGLDSSVVATVQHALIVTPNSHRPLCLDSMEFRGLVRHPLFDADQTRRVLRAWGRGTTMDEFWLRLAPSAKERVAWTPYLAICSRGEEVQERE